MTDDQTYCEYENCRIHKIIEHIHLSEFTFRFTKEDDQKHFENIVEDLIKDEEKN